MTAVDDQAECERRQRVPGPDPNLAPAHDEHRHDADDAEEGTHDEDLRGDEELHDEEGRQAHAVAKGRVLLADDDLVQEGEEDRRDHEHRHRDVAEDERRDDGGRVAEERARPGRPRPST